MGEIEFSSMCFHNYFAYSMYPINQITAIILHKLSARSAIFSTCDFDRDRKLHCLWLQKEVKWNEEHNVLLCCEILISQPLKFKEWTVERGKMWDEIAYWLNNCQTFKFCVSKWSVKEWFKLIKEKFKSKFKRGKRRRALM